MDWISVKVRLPTEKNKTIVCLINGHAILCEVRDATLSLRTGNLYFYWPNNEWKKDKYYGEVTHWMPLSPNLLEESNEHD